VVPFPPYDRNIEWSDGTTTSVYTRERPQLIFSGSAKVGGLDTRVPVALSNGVTPGNATMPGARNGYTGDYSYTHVQRVALG
jgi:hypothetical protein